MLQKEPRCIKSRGVKTFWIWRSRYILLNLSSGKHARIFCYFRRAVLNGKKVYFYKTRTFWKFLLFKSFYPGSQCIVFPSGASVNIWTFFNSCVWVPQLKIVVFESLSVKIWISISYSHCWKGIKYAEDGGNLKIPPDMEDFYEEQSSV